jgi:predicted transport protein
MKVHPVKAYISFQLGNSNIVYLKVRQSKLLIELARTRPEDLTDVENKARYKENSFQRFNQHVTQLDLVNEEDIDYAVGLIRQVYKRFVS